MPLLSTVYGVVGLPSYIKHHHQNNLVIKINYIVKKPHQEFCGTCNNYLDDTMPSVMMWFLIRRLQLCWLLLVQLLTRRTQPHRLRLLAIILYMLPMALSNSRTTPNMRSRTLRSVSFVVATRTSAIRCLARASAIRCLAVALDGDAEPVEGPLRQRLEPIQRLIELGQAMQTAGSKSTQALNLAKGGTGFVLQARLKMGRRRA